MTTTGFATVNFDLWPQLSRYIMIMLMFVGACAGSTGGGIKISRIMILFKTLKIEIEKMMHPNSVKVVKLNKKNNHRAHDKRRECIHDSVYGYSYIINTSYKS